MEKQFIQMQLALFFATDFQDLIEKASLAIKKEFGNDMDTQILNIPPNAPSEIPRLILTSGIVNINLAKNRIDFFAKDKLFVTSNFEKINNIIKGLSVKIGRVGLVSTYFCECDINYLKSLFNESRISSLKLKEITVRFNEDITIQKIRCNNAQMFVSGFVTDPAGNKKSGVIMTRDINSLQDELGKNEFNEILNKFIADALPVAEKFVI
jgi:hypothetical protein